VPLPAHALADVFYTTLKNALLRSLMIAFQVDESELGGFLLPNPAIPGQSRIILYETSQGGSGVLSTLNEPDRMDALLTRMRELLHENDPEGGCEKACYECLLSFYNQRDHAVMDRNAILDWLGDIREVTVHADNHADAGRIEALLALCQSDLERSVIHWLVDHGVRLPDAAQQTIYNREGAPIAISDFYYEPKIVAFVDGSPHYQNYVRDADERKRLALRRLGYRVVVVRESNLEEDILRFREILG
jgi:hypothetical protein